MFLSILNIFFYYEKKCLSYHCIILYCKFIIVHDYSSVQDHGQGVFDETIHLCHEALLTNLIISEMVYENRCCKLIVIFVAEINVPGDAFVCMRTIKKLLTLFLMQRHKGVYFLYNPFTKLVHLSSCIFNGMHYIYVECHCFECTASQLFSYSTYQLLKRQLGLPLF